MVRPETGSNNPQLTAWPGGYSTSDVFQGKPIRRERAGPGRPFRRRHPCLSTEHRTQQQAIQQGHGSGRVDGTKGIIEEHEFLVVIGVFVCFFGSGAGPFSHSGGLTDML